MNNNVEDISAKNRIQISFKEIGSNRKEKIFQIIGDVFVSGFIYIAIILSLISMFKIQCTHFIIIASGLCFIFMMNYFFENFENGIKILIVLVLLLFGFLIFQKKQIINGLFLTMNQIANVVGTHTGTFMHRYEINIKPEVYQLSTTYFWILFSFIIAFICLLSVKNKNNILLWIFILPIFILEVYTGIMPEFFYNLILFFSAILLASYSFINDVKGNKLLGKSKNSMILSTAFMALLIFIIFFLLLNVVRPASNYSKSSISSGIKNTLENKIEDFRYEKKKTNTFTQGDFRKLGKLELLNKPALEVVMDNPTSLYLRGYVGSEYTSERWTDLDNSVYYDSYGLFYWLHKLKFNGLNQLKTVNELTEESKDTDEKINITINNLNANSKYLYTPYEMETKPDEFENVKTFDDSKIMSTSFFGNRLYSYDSTTNLVKKYPTLASNLYDMKDDKEAKEYLENESHYNEFVYENYTKLPRDAKFILKNHLGEVPKTEDTHIPYEKAIKIVKSYLNENIKYKVDIKPVPKGKDFLKYFLEESKEGYATHYATTATLMFRYLGIPSRYVEGYLITPKDVEDVSKLQAITINGTNAHTWTEIYIDGIGWIPIEVTPPYYDIMEKTDTSNYPSSEKMDLNKTSDSSRNLPQGKQEIVDDDQKPKDTNQKQKRKLTTLEKFIISIVLILILIILAYVIYAIRKRKKLKEMKKGFEDSNYKVSIPRIFAYSMSLLYYGGLPIKGGSTYGYIEDLGKDHSKEYVKKFEDAIKINQEAMFSEHEISEEKYNYMRKFMDETLTDLIESKNIFQRMKMKFWDFIY